MLSVGYISFSSHLLPVSCSVGLQFLRWMSSVSVVFLPDIQFYDPNIQNNAFNIVSTSAGLRLLCVCRVQHLFWDQTWILMGECVFFGDFPEISFKLGNTTKGTLLFLFQNEDSFLFVSSSICWSNKISHLCKTCLWRNLHPQAEHKFGTTASSSFSRTI